jgi:tRNA (guanine26-N2/guanine27-N2)-dimethyltransferase
MSVFYNPKSELNRDLTIASIQAFITHYEKTMVRVCTPLAGTGIRAVRIAKEVTDIQEIIAGDINATAVEIIRKNAELNEVEEKIKVYNCDANHLLAYHNRGKLRFDIIDIDPFGSPRDYLAGAIRALRAHALLCLTATDMPVLVGIRRRACIKKYAAEPVRTDYGHELAVRILFGTAVREAAAQNIGLELLLSLYVDHYVRLYCEGRTGAKASWTAVSQLGYLIHCNECGFRLITQKLKPPPTTCPACHSKKVQHGGPLWAGPLAERWFTKNTLHQIRTQPLGTQKRLEQLLNRLLEELDGPPLYFDLHRLADKLNVPVPKHDIILEELRARGEFSSRTHFSPYAIRTTAPEKTICKILLEQS